MPLFVVEPINITDAMFISSSVAETDYDPWSSTATYAAGDRCINPDTHRIIESGKDSNLNHDPNDPANLVSTPTTAAWWIDKAPTNKWALFDGYCSTVTVADSPYTIVIRPGFFDSVYLGGIDADHLHIVIRDAPGGNIIADVDTLLDSSIITCLSDWLFSRFRPMHDFLLTDIAPYHASEITITLTKVVGKVSVGIMTLGDVSPLGFTQWGVAVETKTFSFIDVDKNFGARTIIRRPPATDMTLTSMLDILEANYAFERMKGLQDVPCLYIGSELPNYAATRVFGLGTAKMTFPSPTLVDFNLTVKGSI